MSLSSVVSGSSNASFHQGDNHGRDLVPPMPPPDIRREPPSNFCFDRPPPSMNINQPPPPVKPDNMSSQPTQIRYPKEALDHTLDILFSLRFNASFQHKLDIRRRH